MSSRKPSPWRTGNPAPEARLDLLRAASDAAAPPPGTQPSAAASPAPGASQGNPQSDYWHSLTRAEKKKMSRHGWANWYINRGFISNPPTKKELRALSWRRKK